MLLLLVNSIYGKQAELPRFADFFTKEEKPKKKQTSEGVKTQIKSKLKKIHKEN